MIDRNVLFGFVLDRLTEAPLRTRCSLYRALAELCGDEREARELRALAAMLESADRRCREFAFAWKLKEES